MSNASECPRSNMYMVNPEDLKIITEPGNPVDTLYDPRVNLPVEENMVLNIMHHGLLQNIRIVRRGDEDIVVTGRQRVKAAIEANKRLKKEGKEQVRVPCVLVRGDESAQMGVMISENELREGDSILAKADKCRRYLDMGRTTQEAAVIFGVTEQTIKNWMQIIGLTSSVKKAVDNGVISATAAAKLSGMTPVEQKEAAEKLVDEAMKSGKRRVSIKKAARAAGNVQSMRSKKEIQDALGAADGAWIKATLQWVLGEKDSISL